MSTIFEVPSIILTGGGSSGDLATIVGRVGGRRALIVTDEILFNAGVVTRFTSTLQLLGIPASVYSGVQPDPTVDNVLDGLTALRAHNADVIVAIGGGSPIDAAKAISVLSANPRPLRQYMGFHKVPNRGVPVIAIPTTAGTGSEVTKVAVITDVESNLKMMMLDSHLLPAAAIVDFELSLTMPRALTAHVGVDTLTHGIEAYVSRKATPFTDPLALQCIALVARHLKTAVREPGNRAAREGMMLAATLGGMAFANASVALVHGMSRPVGAAFHVPHGLSNAVLLPAVTRYSLSGAMARYATIARTLGFCARQASDSEAADSLVGGLESLNKCLEIPRLRDCRGVDRARFDALKSKMADDAVASGSPANNPVVPELPDVVRLYDEAW